MKELNQKLALWQQRVRDARTATLRDVALMHVSVYREVIARRGGKGAAVAGRAGF